jgi:hypothetical protein
MPTAHKPRKRYRPRTVRIDATQHAIDRVSVLDADQRAMLTQPLAAALEAFRSGRATLRHWCDLADACNVAEQLARQHIGGEPVVEVMLAAQQALAAVHARHQERGSWTLRGVELRALDDAEWLARWQLEQCSQGEIADAISTVKRRTAGALAGGVGRGTVVVGMLGGDERVA